MKVVYKETIKDQIINVIDHATCNCKEIKRIELTEEEAISFGKDKGLPSIFPFDRVLGVKIVVIADES